MTNANITLDQLTPEQLTNLKKLMAEERKSKLGDVDARNAIIDPMLMQKDGDEFKNTTSDILVALQNAKIVSATIPKADRQEWLKKIQTRKQVLEKQTNEDGSLKHPKGTFGYKSSGVFGMVMTPDRVTDWCMDEANVAKLTAADRKAIIKALSIKL